MTLTHTHIQSGIIQKSDLWRYSIHDLYMCVCVYVCVWWKCKCMNEQFFGLKNLSTRFYLGCIVCNGIVQLQQHAVYCAIHVQVHTTVAATTNMLHITLLNKISALHSTHTYTHVQFTMYNAQVHIRFLSMPCIYYVDKLIVCIHCGILPQLIYSCMRLQFSSRNCSDRIWCVFYHTSIDGCSIMA